MSLRVGLAGKLRTLSTIRTLSRKKIAKVKRSVHILRVLSVGMLWTRRPVLVHIIPMRRCNLACTYCNEYDNFSAPVPLDVMIRRIDKLADLGTGIITISGGEPLLHRDLCRMIAHMRKRGIFVGLISNGYLLNEHRIRRLNEAGLEHCQSSGVPFRRICGCVRGLVHLRKFGPPASCRMWARSALPCDNMSMASVPQAPTTSHACGRAAAPESSFPLHDASRMGEAPLLRSGGERRCGWGSLG